MRGEASFLAGLALSGVLVACSASPPATRGPLPTPSPFKVGLEATPTDVAPTPSFCTGPRAVPIEASVPRRLSPMFADGIGGGPVYAVGLMDSAAVSLDNDTALAQGWPAKELWVINPRHRGPIALSGHNLVTGAPVWFSFSGGSVLRASTHPKLNGYDGGVGWTQFPSYLVFPQAGCYTVSAKWSTGSWHVTVAVGYGTAISPVAPAPEGSLAEARHSVLAAADLDPDHLGQGLSVLSATLETLAQANAAEGVELSTRTNPPSELVWKLWVKDRHGEGSCIVAPPSLGTPGLATTCSWTLRPAIRK
jgi:hypothetical protein